MLEAGVSARRHVPHEGWRSPMAVTFSLTMNSPYTGDAFNDWINTDLSYAASEWAPYLDSNATIRVELDVGSLPNTIGFLVQNDANDFVRVGTNAQGAGIFEPWGEYALQTGSSVPGTPYDIHIGIDLFNNIGNTMLYINPNPAAGGAVPSGEYDLTTMLVKALGYGLGFAAFSTSTALPAFGGGATTPLDQYIQANPSGYSGLALGVDYIGAYEITGPAVEAVAGGPALLDTTPPIYGEAFEHLGNGPTLSGANDIMSIVPNIIGESLSISPLDLAIMHEAGVPIIPGALPCLAAGTRILTPRGLVAIESLRRGRTVLTQSGDVQPIKWIGRRDIDCRCHPDRGRVAPIRVAAHAFGSGRPERDVLLSADHSVFVEGVLIPIKVLVNEKTIARAAVDFVTYYHIELARHDVVLADGLPVETFLDTAGERHKFPTLTWDHDGYARLVVFGREVDRARAKLSVQATLLAASSRLCCYIAAE
jgi:Hint domain